MQILFLYIQYLKGHGHDFGIISFFYFFCLKCHRNAFFFKDHQRLRIGRKALSCKQGSCIFFFLNKLDMKCTSKNHVQANLSSF